MAKFLGSLRSNWPAAALCLPAIALACGNAPDTDTTELDVVPHYETLVTVAADGSVTESSREIDSEEEAELQAAKLAQRDSAGPAPARGSELGTIAQPLVAAADCSIYDLWLYDASGNRLCVRWLGDMDRGLDLHTVLLGTGFCGIRIDGRPFRCTWDGAVTAYWPGEYAGHLGTCLPRDVGLSCDLPVAFPAWGPKTSIDGSQINWVTLPT